MVGTANRQRDSLVSLSGEWSESTYLDVHLQTQSVSIAERTSFPPPGGPTEDTRECL